MSQDLDMDGDEQLDFLEEDRRVLLSACLGSRCFLPAWALVLGEEFLQCPSSSATRSSWRPRWAATASSGSVTATDSAGTLIDELRSYAQYAAANNVFIHLCLWNGAVLRNNNTISLFTDEQKLDSFIQNALTPMVKGLANEPGIGSYEIMNEVRTHFVRAIPAVLSFPRSLCRSLKARSRSPRILIRASTQKPSSAALVPAGLATTSQ